MVAPHDKGKHGNRCRCIHHRGVAKQRLARECRNNLRDDAKRRQDQDINLGVAKEPENMHEHGGVATTGRIKKRSTKMTICQQHGNGAGQHGHHGNHEIGGNQPSPAKHRHFHQRHARRTQIKQGGNDIDRTHDG